MTLKANNFERELAPLFVAVAELRAVENGAGMSPPGPQSAPSQRPPFRSALTALLNSYSKENSSNTPDYLLANFLIGCMDVYDLTVRRRDEWFRAKDKVQPTT